VSYRLPAHLRLPCWEEVVKYSVGQVEEYSSSKSSNSFEGSIGKIKQARTMTLMWVCEVSIGIQSK